MRAVKENPRRPGLPDGEPSRKCRTAGRQFDSPQARQAGRVVTRLQAVPVGVDPAVGL